MARRAKVFVGSTTEGLTYARALSSCLLYDDIDVIPWTYVFRDQPLATNSEQLEELASFDFGVVLFTPDDVTISREKEEPSPRDNLVYELGLLVAYLGRQRVIPLKPSKSPIKLPTDLLGTNPVPYDYNPEWKTTKDCQSGLEHAANVIRDSAKSLGLRQQIPGEPAIGHQSGIVLPSRLHFDEEAQRLRLRIGYQGPGVLFDVEMRTHFASLRPAEGVDSYQRNWRRIRTRTRRAPVIEVAWTTSHRMESNGVSRS